MKGLQGYLVRVGKRNHAGCFAFDASVCVEAVQGAISLIGTNGTVKEEILFFLTSGFVLRILISPLRAFQAVAGRAAFVEDSSPHPTWLVVMGE